MSNLRFFGTALALTASLVAAEVGGVNAQPTAAPLETPAFEIIPRAHSPRMTLIPESHLMAAFQVRQNGRSVYIDTQGKVIGRMAPGTQQVLWNGNSPLTYQPLSPATVIFPVTPDPVPKQK